MKRKQHNESYSIKILLVKSLLIVKSRGAAKQQIIEQEGQTNHTNKRSGLFVENSAGQQVEVILDRVHDHCVSRVISSLKTQGCYQHERKYRDKIKTKTKQIIEILHHLFYRQQVSMTKTIRKTFLCHCEVMRIVKVVVSAFTSITLPS